MLDDAAGRLHLRFRIQVPVEVRLGRRWEVLQTEDVGFGGLFVRTEAPAAPRQLLQLHLDLPFGMGPFKATAVVARSIPAHNPVGTVPGMGVAFYGLGRPEQETWDRMMQRVAVECPGTSEKPLSAVACRLAPPEPLLRASPGIAAALDVALDVAEDLFVVYSRDVTRGGMFLATDAVFPPGSELALRVVHEKSGTEAWLRCVVRRSVSGRRTRGLGVELVADELEQRQLRETLGALIDRADEQTPV